MSHNGMHFYFWLHPFSPEHYHHAQMGTLVVLNWSSELSLPPSFRQTSPLHPPLTLLLEHENVSIMVSFHVQIGPQPFPLPFLLSPFSTYPQTYISYYFHFW